MSLPPPFYKAKVLVAWVRWFGKRVFCIQDVFTKVNYFIVKSKVGHDYCMLPIKQMYSLCTEIFINDYDAYVSIKNSH